VKLSRTDWKYVVDTLMVLSILGVTLIGLLMAFVIPEGRLEAGQSKYFLGLHRHQWGDIHLDLSLALAALVIVHVVLAWGWIKGKARGLFGRSWAAAVGLTVLAAVLVPALFWLAASKNDPAYAEFGEGRGGQGRRFVEAGRPAGELLDETSSPGNPGSPAAGPAMGGEPAAAPGLHQEKAVAGRMEEGTSEAVITGQMTLRDVERVTGAAAKEIAARLGLPPEVSLDERLGRLRRVHGFEMQALRDTVAELLRAKRPALTLDDIGRPTLVPDSRPEVGGMVFDMEGART